VDAFAGRAHCPVIFTTQEDAGFRKARALNNAIRETNGESLLFLDGDCIPPPRWAERHLAGLESSDFTVGGYVWLSLLRAQSLSAAQIAGGGIDATILPHELRRLRSVHRREEFYRWLGRGKKPRILGGNWAVRRTALVAVNGFDERFDGFTKEDSDIRNRLRNAGYRGRSQWNNNWVFHCAHELDPRRNRPDAVRGAPDYDYYESRAKATTCELGLAQGGAGPA
jgi:GT2 family glycosyltransferase